MDAWEKIEDSSYEVIETKLSTCAHGHEYESMKVFRSKDPTRYKMSKSGKYNSGDIKMDSSGNTVYGKIAYQTTRCDKCQEEYEKERVLLNEHDRERSHFSRLNGEKLLSNVVSVKKHANWFMVETNDGTIHAIQAGDYSFKTYTPIRDAF